MTGRRQRRAPLPTKLATTVRPAITPREGEPQPEFAARVQAAMQAALTQLTAHRRPVVG